LLLSGQQKRAGVLQLLLLAMQQDGVAGHRQQQQLLQVLLLMQCVVRRRFCWGVRGYLRYGWLYLLLTCFGGCSVHYVIRCYLEWDYCLC
jgi:hypothetical protein